MSEAHPSKEQIVIGKVMEAIEECYFSDGPDSAEAIFANFAKDHSHLFEGEVDINSGEQKLEWTNVYKQF